MWRKTIVAVVVGTFMVSGLPAATAGESVGLVDADQGQWHLRDPVTGRVSSFFFGNPDDLPIVGDWDGDGVATPGLYRQSDGFFYARNSNTQGPADAECFAGDPADIPIAGDWDGDGDGDLGIYRPSEQMFYLFTATCTGSPMGAAPISFLFGNPGDKPVSGDWDGDGIDEVGLHRESTGFFYWRNTLDTGIASGEIFFGDPGDRFVSGDWGVVDGADTPAVFRPSSETFFYRHTLTQGVADSQLTWGTDSWLPVAGDFGQLGRSIPEIVAGIQEQWDAAWAADPWGWPFTGPGLIVCTDTRTVFLGDVFACLAVSQTLPGYELENAGMVFLVLDDQGAVAANSGTDLPASTEDVLHSYAMVEKGLFCYELLEEGVGHPFGGSGTTPKNGYFGALAYWFLEGRPDRMDADRNGIPCETVFPADVVQWVWSGAWLS
jgi:hypothetical protein